MKLKDRNLWTFLMIAGCSYIIMNEIVHIISIRTGRTGEKNDILKVRLCHHGVTLDTCGLFDSGNSLREPISGQPVHIIDYEAAEKIIKGGREKTGETIRVVPFHSMGREGGMLTAFLCDNVWIDRKGDYVNLGPAYIGIYRGKLSVTGQYHMILNRSINKWL
jgi:stage II sporulation protein GA (sporulation sigma-E factor processing peptidase)